VYRLFRRLLPASLVSRVMLYYGFTLFLFLVTTVAAITAHEFEQEIDTSQQQAVMMIEVLVKVVMMMHQHTRHSTFQSENR